VETGPAEVFAVDFATLAREVAMDIFPVETILELHRLSQEEWAQISSHPRFISMLVSMQRDWQSASNTRERVKVKSATGLESMLEIYIRDINDPAIPLNQRVEAGKFLARLGELDAQRSVGLEGGGVTINIVTGRDHLPVTIEAKANRPLIEAE
jgi:hypothetical protein